MALPYAFANVTELDTPQLDSNFNALGALTIIPCTASGQNTIALVPAANTPTISAYTSLAPIFSFVAVATTNSSPVTINVSGIGAKNVYKANGAALIGSNDFISGGLYAVSYNSALNSSSGGFVVVNPGATSAAAGSIQGTRKNLVVTNTTATAAAQTKIIITADALSVSDGSTAFNSVLNVNVTINSATSGANGIDAGSIANSTWYAVYLIYNPSTLTAAGLISTSFTNPTLPSGYSQFARVGSARTDASAHFVNFMQKGNRVQYLVGVYNGATLSVAPVLAGPGTAGNTGTTWSAVTVSTFVPPTASKILGAAQAINGSSSLIVAPNSSYGFLQSATNSPPVQVINTTTIACYPFEFLLEGTTIQWANSGSGQYLQCLGYEDNL